MDDISDAVSGGNAAMLQPDSRRGLLTVHTSPRWAHEKYVLRGYRLNLSVREALASIAYLHSETANIWTHLLELGISAYLYYFFLFSSHAFVDLSPVATWALHLSFWSELVKCLLSAQAHTLCCVSYQVKNVVWAIDYAGTHCWAVCAAVTLALFSRRGGFCSTESELHDFLDIVFFFHVVYFFAAAMSRLAPPSQSERIRLSLAIVLFLSTHAPLFHRILLLPWAGDPAIPIWCIYLACLFSAGIVMGSHCPERLSPGIADYMFRSHDLMHFLTGLAAWTNMIGLATDIHTLREHGRQLGAASDAHILPDGTDTHRFLAYVSTLLGADFVFVVLVLAFIFGCFIWPRHCPVPDYEAEPVPLGVYPHLEAELLRGESEAPTASADRLLAGADTAHADGVRLRRSNRHKERAGNHHHHQTAHHHEQHRHRSHTEVPETVARSTSGLLPADVLRAANHFFDTVTARTS